MVIELKKGKDTMKHMKKTIIFIILIGMLAGSSVSSLAGSIEIDYDSLTLSELEQIIQDANNAITKNHVVDYSIQSDLESKTKVSVVQMMPDLQREPSWRWFDWTYRRDWDNIEVITEVKINGEWLPLEADYIDSNGDYELIQLVVGGKNYFDNTDGIGTRETQSDKIENEISSDDNNNEDDIIQEGIVAQIGDNKERVSEIQSMLIKLGYAKGKPNGVFDEKTEKVVKKFQKKNGLKETGIVTDSVYAALLEAYSNIPKEEKPKKVERVSAAQLQKDYDDNEVSADLKYKGQEIEVTGQVQSVDKVWGTMYVYIEADWFQSIHCSMKSEQIDRVAGLKSGQNVVIRGKCTGMLLGIVSLDKCEIVS